jgi:hypothetical protein
MANIVRTGNENLGRQFLNAQGAGPHLRPVEVGGWSKEGQSVHDVSDVTKYGGTAGRAMAEATAQKQAKDRGEKAYFDAYHVVDLDPRSGKVIPS